MKVRKFYGDVFNGDLEDLFNEFFAPQDVTDARCLDLGTTSVNIEKGKALFLLGGRNSIVQKLRDGGINHIRTVDGTCLSITFKANITRKGEFVKTAAKQAKKAVGVPLVAVTTPIVIYNRTGGTDVLTSAKHAAKSLVHSIEAMERMQEYNRKTCVIVEIFNNDTDGKPVPAKEHGLINDDVTFSTMATLLEQLFITKGASA